MSTQRKAPARANEPGAKDDATGQAKYHEPATSEQLTGSMFEAEAYASTLRAVNHAAAAAQAMADAGRALDAAKRDDLSRDLAKVAELHRLCVARLTSTLRRLAEVSP